MEKLDVNKLLRALENDKNASLIKEDLKTIETVKMDMIKTLHLSEKDTQTMLGKLNHYRFVDELPDMKYGSYIKWMRLTNPDVLRLTNGGIVCEMKVGVNGIIVVCRNNLNKYFQVNMSESLIFRKLTEQELILLSALNFINNS